MASLQTLNLLFFFFFFLINPLLLHVHEILVRKTKYARDIVYGDVLLAVPQTSSRLGIAKSQFSSRGPRENTMLSKVRSLQGIKLT